MKKSASRSATRQPKQRHASSGCNSSGGSGGSVGAVAAVADFRSSISQKVLADASHLSAPLISRIYSTDPKQRRDNLTLRSLLKLQQGLKAVTGTEWTLDAIAQQIAQ